MCFSISMTCCWLRRLSSASRGERIRPSPDEGPGMQSSRPSDGANGHAFACIMTLGRSQSAWYSTTLPASIR